MVLQFFKTFWKFIGDFIVKSINYGYVKGKLSETKKCGKSTCLRRKVINRVNF